MSRASARMIRGNCSRWNSSFNTTPAKHLAPHLCTECKRCWLAINGLTYRSFVVSATSCPAGEGRSRRSGSVNASTWTGSVTLRLRRSHLRSSSLSRLLLLLLLVGPRSVVDHWARSAGQPASSSAPTRRAVLTDARRSTSEVGDAGELVDGRAPYSLQPSC